jgi:antitoxin ParD1/3/4
MKVELNPEVEQMIEQDVQRGNYSSVDEYLDRAVRILHQEEALLALDGKIVDEEIALGIAQLDRGEGVSGEVARKRLQDRKAQLVESSPRQ